MMSFRLGTFASITASVCIVKKKFCFFESDFNLKLTDFQKKIRASKNVELSMIKFKKLGLTKKEIVEYIIPEIKIILNKIKNVVEYDPVKEEIFVVKNECKLNFFEGVDGRFLNEIEFYEKIYKKLTENTKNIKIKINTQNFNLKENNKIEFQEKSCFSTNFQTSSASRKHNIKLALSCFDGFVLEDGEVCGSGTYSDADQLPDGRWMTKQSFWLNNDYIMSVLEKSLTK